MLPFVVMYHPSNVIKQSFHDSEIVKKLEFNRIKTNDAKNGLSDIGNCTKF